MTVFDRLDKSKYNIKLISPISFCFADTKLESSHGRSAPRYLCAKHCPTVWAWNRLPGAASVLGASFSRGVCVHGVH